MSNHEASTINLQENWDANLSFDEHVKKIQEGINAIHDSLIIGGVVLNASTSKPVTVSGYDRYDIAYALQLTGGGGNNGVVAVGNGSTGKTAFGDLLHGNRNRTEVNPQDIEATIYGEESVVDHKRTTGKLKGMKQDNPTAYVNEFGLLEDQTPFYRLFDSEFVEVTGEDLELVELYLEDIVAYLTTNFPKRGGGGIERINPMTGPMGSRIAAEILTGDHSSEIQTLIMSAGRLKRPKSPLAPIAPKADVRSALHEAARERYTERDEDIVTNSQFMQNVREGIVETGLLVPIESADGVARTGQHWYANTRANMLVQEIQDPELMQKSGARLIKPRHIAQVGALILPTRYRLSSVAKNDKMAEAAGRRPSNMEQAIAIRRIIAHVAIQELMAMDPNQSFTDDQIAMQSEAFIARYSFANAKADGVGFDIDQALFAKDPVVEEQSDGKRKRFLTRKTR